MERDGSIQMRQLGPDDLPAIRRVDEACVIDADMALHFDRGPDFFAWPRTCLNSYKYLGAEVDGELIAFGMGGEFTGRIDGRAAPCFYAGDARVVPAWRRRGVMAALTYEGINHVQPETDDGFLLVAAGNRAGAGSAAYLARHPDFPGAVVALVDAVVLPVLGRMGAPRSITTRSARAEDAPVIAELIREHLHGRPFAPMPSAEDVVQLFSRPGLDPATWVMAYQAGRPVGVLGAWDMAPLRSTEVVRYSARGQLLRGVYAAVRRVRPAIRRLPRPGEPLRVLTTTHVAASDPAVLRTMLAWAVERGLAEGYHAVTVAFVGDDPLVSSVRGLLRLPLRSAVYRFRRGGPPPLDDRPWVDLSFL